MVRKSTAKEHQNQQRSAAQKDPQHAKLGSATGGSAITFWKRIPAWGSYLLIAYMPLHIFLSQWLSTYTGGLEAWKVAKDVVTMALVWLSFGLVVWEKLVRRSGPSQSSYRFNFFSRIARRRTSSTATDTRRKKLDIKPISPQNSESDSGTGRLLRKYWWFVGLAFAYLGLHIGLYFYNQSTNQDIAALATVYNNRILWYLIIGYSAVLLTPQSFSTTKLLRLVVIISTVVCLFGLLQYALPKDVMTNFGYSIERGVKPAFFIDDKPDLPRVFSTVRDPNSLGAFLIVPLTILWLKLLGVIRGMGLKAKRFSEAIRPWMHQPFEQIANLPAGLSLFGGLFLLHSLVLLLTFSRASWIGAALSLLIATAVTQRQWLEAWARKYWRLLLVLLVIVLGSAYLLRDQYFVQNILFHSDETTQAELDSNELHFALAEKGVQEFTDNPLGDGPGTAGIVSIQNQNGGLLTENYYIQILHEVGIAGLALLVLALYLVHRALKETDLLGAALFASFWAYALMAMVMHLWTNETVALQWWLLAGFYLGLHPGKHATNNWGPVATNDLKNEQ